MNSIFMNYFTMVAATTQTGTDLSGAKISVIITFAIYSIAVLGIGFYSQHKMSKSKTENFMDDFYTGGRGMGVWVLVFLLAAGLCSAGTFIGSPGMAYSVGMVFVLACMAQSFMNFSVLGEVGTKVGIVARRINAQSAQDLLNYRYNFNKPFRWISAIAILVFYTANVVAQLTGGTRLIQVMTGLDYRPALFIFGLIIVVYTTIGGIKGVTNAVVFQGITMTAAIIVLFIVLLAKINPMGAAYQAIAAKNASVVTPWVWTPWYTFSMFVSLGLVTIGQPHGLMSSLMYKNTKGMHRAMFVGAIVVSIWTAAIVWSGNLGRALLPNLKVSDYVVPSLAVYLMPGWIAGLVLAGVAAAIQSTVASVVMVISSSLVRDIYLVVKPTKDPKKIKSATIIATLIAGLIPIIIAINPPQLLQYLILYAIGGLTSSFFWPTLLGLYWKRTTEEGALAGLVGGMVFFILAQGKYIPNFGMHGIVVGIVVSGILTIGVSLITKRPPKHIIEVFWGKNQPEDPIKTM
mgnify:CR=1 FL=1